MTTGRDCEGWVDGDCDDVGYNDWVYNYNYIVYNWVIMIRFIMMRVGYGGYDYTGDYDDG